MLFNFFNYNFNIKIMVLISLFISGIPLLAIAGYLEIVTKDGCSVSLDANGAPPNEATWSGSCVDGRAQGQGVLKARWGQNSIKYEGLMSGGMFNGKGRYDSLSGKTYIGDFVNGRPASLSTSKSKDTNLNSESPKESSLTAAGTDSSMCQGDTVTYGKSGGAGFKLGTYIFRSLDPSEQRRLLIEYAEGAIISNLDWMSRSERVGDMGEAREYKKAAEFLQCHQANNWPTINWLDAALKLCLSKESKSSDGSDFTSNVNRCGFRLAAKYHRMGQ